MVSFRLSNSEVSPPTGSVTVKARESSRSDDGSALQSTDDFCISGVILLDRMLMLQALKSDTECVCTGQATR